MDDSKEAQGIFNPIEFRSRGLCSTDGSRVGGANASPNIRRTERDSPDHGFDAQHFLDEHGFIGRHIR